MGIAYDDFERDDGALGLSWVVFTGTWNIAGGKAVNTGASGAYLGAVNAPTTASAEVDTYLDGTYTAPVYPFVKGNAANTDRYEGRVWYTAGTYNCDIYRVTGGSGTRIARVAATAVLPSPYRIKLTYTSGYLALFVEGAFVVGAVDSTHDANERVGMLSQTANGAVGEFTGAGEQTVTLTVTPFELGTESGDTQLSLVGEYTDWTSGTPGSPVFTCSAGFLSDQTIASATTATVTFTPPATAQTVTIYDPTNGVYDTINVVEGLPAEEPDTTCLLTVEGADLVNDTATAHSNTLLLTEATSIHATEAPELNVDIVQAIAEIWAGMYHFGAIGSENGLEAFLGQLLIAMMGSDTPTVSLYTAERTTSIREELEGVTNRLETLITPTAYTLENVIASVKGLDNRSVTQVYDLVDALTTGSNQDVLDALAAYFGVSPPTIAQLGTMVENLATIAGYDLGDVLDAIADIPGVDLSSITNKLNAIQPNTDYTLTTLTTRLNDLQIDSTAILDQLDTIQSLIENLPTSTPTSGAPVWPGVANVTLGTVVTLEEEPDLTGPFDGVLINITTPPTRTGLRQFGTAPMDYGVGEIAFVTDNGYIEPWQYLGFRTALYTPKMMRQASAVKCRVLAGAEGTIRTFTST